MEQQITRDLAFQTGMAQDLVQFLRNEFKKFGRNPLDSSIEILAIENGLDEVKVKHLYALHSEYLRKMDGLADQKRGMC